MKAKAESASWRKPAAGWWLRGAWLAVLAGLAACSAGKARQPLASEAVPVLVATVERKDMPLQLRAIGAVEAFSTVSVKSNVAGQITGVYFKEGQDVSKGQLLFTIDKRPLQAELSRQEGNLAHDIAQAENARVQARRYEALMKDGVVAKEQADAMISSAAALDAAVVADRAAVENARVQLQYCDIYSPIAGRTGSLMVHAGNIVKANDTPYLLVINQIKPIHVTFSVPEQFLPEIKRYQAAKGSLPVQANIPQDVGPAPAGWLSFIDNAVDQATGTIKLKGTFQNQERRLWPGQFVNVVMTLTTQPNAIVVPSQAVQTGQQGQFVFVVKPDLRAEARPVVVARTTENQTIIQEGLQPGERVVTDGQLRLAPGTKVEIKTAVLPNQSNTSSQQLLPSAPAGDKSRSALAVPAPDQESRS